MRARTNLQQCIALVKQMALACAEGKSTARLWTKFHEIEAKLTTAEVSKLTRYVNISTR